MLSRLTVTRHSPGVRHRRAAIALTWGLLLLALALFWLLTGPAEAARAADDPPETAQVWTVCPAGPPDCTYSVIQDAVDAAGEGDVIKVATGLYTDVHGRAAPPGYDGPSVITQVVYISKTATVRGGYTTTNWITPDPEAHPTTLDAEGQGRVLFIAGQISPTVEGLRLTGGDATGLGGGWWSGGDAGGGVYVVDATATISRNQVFSNTAVHLGGGLYLDHSPATLSRNDIIANSAGGSGGGLFLGGSPATLSGNTIVANAANNDSGGLFLEFSDARLTNNIIADNQGGLYVSWSSPRLWHTTFARNGTGIYLDNEFLPPTVLTNTILVSHTVGVYVDVMYGWEGGVRMKATLWGDGAWANETDLFCPEGLCSTGAINIWGEPDFVDPDSGDYHIALGSAALDAGLDAGIASDIDGEPRPAALGFDIGADELSGTIPLLRKAAWPPAINPGQMVTYTLSITSAGACTATSVWLTDTLPALQRPLSITATRGSCAVGTGWGGGATCDLGTMPPGARAIVTLTAQVTTTLPARPLRVMRNVAWITSAETTNRKAVADTVMQDCHIRLNDDPVEYATVQAAVDASSHPADVVRVAGTCSGAVSQAGIDQVAYLDKTLTLQGGWNISFMQRNVIGYPTTLDALGQGRVLYITGPVSPTVEGLQITGGDAYGLAGGPWACGPCQGAGGGIYVATAQATISDSRVFSNTGFFGGGLFLTDSPATLSGTTIAFNTAGRDASDNGCGCLGYGGGLYLESSPAVLSGSTVISNTGYYGGGLQLESSPAILRENAITDNIAVRGSGARLSSGSDALLVNNVVAGNQGNRWWSSGNGLYIDDCSPRLLHTTIARNTGGNGSGIYVSDGGTVALTNTILVSQTVGIAVSSDCTVTLESTLWHGNGDDWYSIGAVYHDNDYAGAPAFVDPGAGDYHIGLGSAARDRGVDAGVYADTDGEPRPAGLGYDLGADEFHGPGVAVIKQAHVDPVAAGAQLTYTLRVTNNGTVSLTATISDVLPGQVTPTGVLTWTPPPILPGDAWTETVAVTVEVGYAGPLTNVVRVSTEEGVTGAVTISIRAEEAIAGLEAANDSPTVLGEPTALTATVTAGSHVSYTWTFGDGELGSGAVVSHTYPAPGVYTAIVTAGNRVSELTATTAVTVDEAIAGLETTNDSPTALGEPTLLTATVTAGSNVTYTWAFGDGEAGNGAVVSHTYPTVGVYTAVVTASNSVGELTATTTVTIDEAIAGLEATNDSPTVFGEPTALTATVTAGSYVSYTWGFGDGEVSSGAAVIHTYPAIGVYTAVVTACNSVSILTATTPVTVAEPISGLLVVNDSPTVLGDTTTFTASVTAGSDVTYTWDLGDGTIGQYVRAMHVGEASRQEEASEPFVLTHVYPAVGIYTAIFTASNSLGELTATTTVTIDEAIAGLEASNDSPTVLGEPTAFSAAVTAGSNVRYTWAFGDGEAGSGAVVSHTYPSVGVYTAVVTAGNSVSELTATTMVTIDEAIAGLEASNDSPTVLGEPTAFSAAVTAGSNITYSWAFGDGEADSGAVVTHTYADVGIYPAVVTAGNSVSQLTATTTVTITDVPIAGLEASNDSPTVLGSPTTLTATVAAGSNVTYTWAFGDGEIGSGAVVTHTYTAVGIYTAVVTASNSVGELTATTTVEIAGPTIYIYLPLVLRE